MSLHIPSRVQEELKEGLSLETDAQDFYITIKHGYYAPVATVTSDAESGRSSGSSNVYLVRNFLDKILGERKAGKFVLDYIGPSPFHADFEIRKLVTGEAAGMPVVMTQNVRPGYNEVIWHVDTKQITLERAIAEILGGIQEDADLFYHIVQGRNSVLRAWVEASQLANEVTGLEQQKSIRRRIRSHALKSRRIKDAIVSVTEYQMLNISQRSKVSLRLKDHKWAIYGGIKEFCEREFDNLERFPAEELRGLLEFLENRVRHVDNLVITLLAAMVGGLVGGALAMLAA
jgi:hypothetical protein